VGGGLLMGWEVSERKTGDQGNYLNQRDGWLFLCWKTNNGKGMSLHDATNSNLDMRQNETEQCDGRRTRLTGSGTK